MFGEVVTAIASERLRPKSSFEMCYILGNVVKITSVQVTFMGWGVGGGGVVIKMCKTCGKSSVCVTDVQGVRDRYHRHVQDWAGSRHTDVEHLAGNRYTGVEHLAGSRYQYRCRTSGGKSLQNIWREVVIQSVEHLVGSRHIYSVEHLLGSRYTDVQLSGSRYRTLMTGSRYTECRTFAGKSLYRRTTFRKNVVTKTRTFGRKSLYK